MDNNTNNNNNNTKKQLQQQKCGFVLTSELIEMIPNIIGLVIVPCILVVNELYTAWKQKVHCLDSDAGYADAMIMLFPFNNSELSKLYVLVS